MLFHFSEEKDVAVFKPRPVAVPAPRAPGMDWLNDPLVWAIDDWHQPMYLFPRNCPRILIWPTAKTTPQDRRQYWTTPHRMRAYIAGDWLSRVSSATIYRYTLPDNDFQSLDDAGMWVARSAVTPGAVQVIADLPGALVQAGVELHVVPDLKPLLELRQTSLHISSIRLRNIPTSDAS